MRDLTELDKYRDILAEQRMFGASDSTTRPIGGCFWIPTKGSHKGMKVIASSGQVPSSKGWDHVSVSLPNRTPTWGEMCKIKDLFFHPHEVCMQLHPAEVDHISNHGNCLHIWRNRFQEIPLPPVEMVGVKELGSIREGGIGLSDIHTIQDQIDAQRSEGFVETIRDV